MKNENQDESIANAINSITEKLSHVLLQEFLTLPKALQINRYKDKNIIKNKLLYQNIQCQ